MKNIAVALDLSRGAEELMHKTYQMSQMYNAKIWLMHVVEPDPVIIDVYNAKELVQAERQKDLKKMHQQVLVYEKELKFEGAEVETVVVEGDASETLLYELDKHNIDLLIIGNNQHGFFYKTFVGSIFSQIIDKVEIPVLAIPFKN